MLPKTLLIPALAATATATNTFHIKNYTTDSTAPHAVNFNVSINDSNVSFHCTLPIFSKEYILCQYPEPGGVSMNAYIERVTGIYGEFERVLHLKLSFQPPGAGQSRDTIGEKLLSGSEKGDFDVQEGRIPL